jgi:hypothetical protein
LSKNAAVEARYVGNHGYDLFQTLNANPNIANLFNQFPNLVPAGLTPCPAASAFAPVAIGRINCNEGIVRQRANTGFSNYNALQTEFRANNLFKQLTIRTAYTFSKTLDNVSEIFSTFGGGNSSFIYQNPANPGFPGEYSFSGLDFPQQWTILFNEQLPFFKEQHGLVGHILGGWSVAANYVVASGQRYTPTQFFAARATGTNFFDTAFTRSFNSSVESARPFLGSLSAPATSVGMYAGDACGLFSFSGTPQHPTIDPLCAGDPNQLINLTAVGKSGCESDFTKDCPFVPVQKNQVRFIANTGIAQTVFGTPFGNMPRNPVADAMTQIGNASIYKNIKLGEHASFEFHTTFLNMFNQANFTSIDPILEDAGANGAFNGFGDVTQTPSVNRRIIFGGKLTF